MEEVFSALSLLLNGGGVAQLRTINRELTQVMQGREGDIKSVIDQLDTFIGGLDSHKSEIVRALDGQGKTFGKSRRHRSTLRTLVLNLTVDVGARTVVEKGQSGHVAQTAGEELLSAIDWTRTYLNERLQMPEMLSREPFGFVASVTFPFWSQ